MKRLLIIILTLLLMSSAVYGVNTFIDGTQILTNSIPTNKIIGDVYTKAQSDATIEAAIATIPSGGGTAIEDTAMFISSNVFEFSTDYSTAEALVFRNGIYQPRRLFTTEDVAGKTRIYFISSINDSDEIVLISTTGE